MSNGFSHGAQTSCTQFVQVSYVQRLRLDVQHQAATFSCRHGLLWSGFCSLQELKTTQAFDRVISNSGISFRLISFGQDSGKRGGLGFVMSPRVEISLVQHKRLSNRVGFADFKFPHPHNGKNKKTKYSMCALSQLTDLPVHWSMWSTAKRRALVPCAGDFNSRGKWNDNGDALVHWATSRGLLSFATPNTTVRLGLVS